MENFDFAFESDFVANRAWASAIDDADVIDDSDWEPLPEADDDEIDEDVMSLVAHRPSRRVRASLR